MTYAVRNQRAEMRRLRQTEHPTLSEIGDRVGASKQAGERNDMRSRRIVRQQWREREGDTAGAPPMRGQMAIFDFKAECL